MFSRFEAWNNITKNGDNIVITTHSYPDGDAIGSCYALAQALKIAGKNPVVVLSEYNGRFDFVAGKEFVHTGDMDALPCDVFISLDCGDKSRVGSSDALFNKTSVTINIDHHINNSNFSRYNYIDTEASSTCEMIFNIINMSVPITKDIAAALYMGIMTDTGSFRFRITSPQTMEIISLLMSTGIDFSDIQLKALHVHSKQQAKVFGIALNNMGFADGAPIAFTCISQKELEAVGGDYNDLGGIAQYMSDIEGMEVGLLFSERSGGRLKVSFRSQSIPINDVAIKFGGGGHELACSAVFEANMQKGVDDVLSALRALLAK